MAEPTEITIARARARKLLGESAWNSLSEPARENAIDDEFRTMDAERVTASDVPDSTLPS
jgi:hypothetical protein